MLEAARAPMAALQHIPRNHLACARASLSPASSSPSGSGIAWCAPLVGQLYLLRRRNYASAPHLSGDLDDHAQLRPLLLLGEHVALFGGSEAALRREAKLIEGGEFGRFLDPAFDVVLLFQLAGFCRDEPEHDDLVAFGQEA